MASTVQGGGQASTAAVPQSSNSSQGGLMSNFYKPGHVVPADRFYVQAIPKSGYNSGTTIPPAGDVSRIMSVGDSITQGLEGDYTWRYRLFQHTAQFGPTYFSDVGPWTGTSHTGAAYRQAIPT